MRAFEPIGKRVPRITLETAVVLIRRNWHNADGSELWRLGCRRSSAEGDGRLDTNKSWSMKADLITTGPETTLKALWCRRTDARSAPLRKLRPRSSPPWYYATLANRGREIRSL